jgi:hypothetical protein
MKGDLTFDLRQRRDYGVHESVETTNLVIEFIIPEFIEDPTCFERHTAHHQELQTVFAANFRFMVPCISDNNNE